MQGLTRIYLAQVGTGLGLADGLFDEQLIYEPFTLQYKVSLNWMVVRMLEGDKTSVHFPEVLPVSLNTTLFSSFLHTSSFQEYFSKSKHSVRIFCRSLFPLHMSVAVTPTPFPMKNISTAPPLYAFGFDHAASVASFALFLSDCFSITLQTTTTR